MNKSIRKQSTLVLFLISFCRQSRHTAFDRSLEQNKQQVCTFQVQFRMGIGCDKQKGQINNKSFILGAKLHDRINESTRTVYRNIDRRTNKRALPILICDFNINADWKLGLNTFLLNLSHPRDGNGICRQVREAYTRKQGISIPYPLWKQQLQICTC